MFCLLPALILNNKSLPRAGEDAEVHSNEKCKSCGVDEPGNKVLPG